MPEKIVCCSVGVVTIGLSTLHACISYEVEIDCGVYLICSPFSRIFLAYVVHLAGM